MPAMAIQAETGGEAERDSEKEVAHSGGEAFGERVKAEPGEDGGGEEERPEVAEAASRRRRLRRGRLRR